MHLSLAKLEIDSTRESEQGGTFDARRGRLHVRTYAVKETCHHRISSASWSLIPWGVEGEGKKCRTWSPKEKECSLDHERCSNRSLLLPPPLSPFSPWNVVVFLYFPQMCFCVRVFSPIVKGPKTVLGSLGGTVLARTYLSG